MPLHHFECDFPALLSFNGGSTLVRDVRAACKSYMCAKSPFTKGPQQDLLNEEVKIPIFFPS